MTEIVAKNQYKIPGTAVFMTATAHGTPTALLHNVKHNKVLHEHVMLLTILTEPSPHANPDDQIEIEDLSNGFFRVVARYGFMETPNVPELLQRCEARGLPTKLSDTTFYLGRETLIATSTPGMAIWREKLFAFMSRNASRATDYFQIPAERAIEIGSVIEM
jgi:KUP system potassium uptake protein